MSHTFLLSTLKVRSQMVKILNEMYSRSCLAFSYQDSHCYHCQLEYVPLKYKSRVETVWRRCCISMLKLVPMHENIKRHHP